MKIPPEGSINDQYIQIATLKTIYKLPVLIFGFYIYWGYRHQLGLFSARSTEEIPKKIYKSLHVAILTIFLSICFDFLNSLVDPTLDIGVYLIAFFAVSIWISFMIAGLSFYISWALPYLESKRISSKPTL